VTGVLIVAPDVVSLSRLQDTSLGKDCGMKDWYFTAVGRRIRENIGGKELKLVGKVPWSLDAVKIALLQPLRVTETPCARQIHAMPR
jgi:hypothetical protein